MDPKLDVRREAGPQVQYSRLHVWGGLHPWGGLQLPQQLREVDGCHQVPFPPNLGSLHAGWSFSQMGETASALLLTSSGSCCRMLVFTPPPPSQRRVAPSPAALGLAPVVKGAVGSRLFRGNNWEESCRLPALWSSLLVCFWSCLSPLTRIHSPKQ